MQAAAERLTAGRSLDVAILCQEPWRGRNMPGSAVRMFRLVPAVKDRTAHVRNPRHALQAPPSLARPGPGRSSRRSARARVLASQWPGWSRGHRPSARIPGRGGDATHRRLLWARWTCRPARPPR